MFVNKEWIHKVETALVDITQHIRHSDKIHHKHRTFIEENSLSEPLIFPLRPYEHSIDAVVKILWDEREEIKAIIKQQQAELSAIHAHYRDFLCGDCCHQDVCKIKDTVKYGYECEDKDCPELLDIEVELLGEELKPEEKEES